MITLDDVDVTVQDVVDYLRISGEFDAFLQTVTGRKLAVEAAKEAGIEVTDSELQEAADNFRSAMGLDRAEDTEKWLEAKGISIDDLENHLEENVMVYKWKTKLEEETDVEEILKDERVREDIRSHLFSEWTQEVVQRSE